MARLIAIDLGAHSVKVTTFRLVGRGGFELEGRYQQLVPQNGGPISSGQRLAALDALLVDHPEWGNVATQKALSWPATRTTFRRITLPFVDAQKVEQTLPFALEAEVPFDMEDMVLGKRVLSSDGSTKVLTVLTHHDALEQGIADLAERGLDPNLVIVDGDVQGYWSAEEGACAVVDVGHTHTLVTITEDAQVHLVRPLNVGGLHFTRAIQQALDVSWAEAEEIKHGSNEVDEDDTDPGLGRGSAYSRLPVVARQAVDGQIGLLLAEIRSVLIAAEDELGIEISEVRLTGGGSRWSELWDYLAQDLGLPIARPVDHEGDPVPGAFAVSHALAMRLVGETRGREIDLRLDDLSFKGGVDISRAVLAYGFSGLAFFTLAALVTFAVQFRSLSVEQSQTEERLTGVVQTTFPDIPPNIVDDINTAAAAMEGQTLAAVERAQVMRNLQSGVPPTVNLIAELTSAFPAHPDVVVNVSDLNVTPTSVSFTAETDGYASSAAVEEALQQHPRFALAKKGDDNKKGSKVVFPVKIPFEADDSADEEG